MSLSDAGTCAPYEDGQPPMSIMMALLHYSEHSDMMA